MTIPKIRRAVKGDSPGIANVHLNSWRETYSSLLPVSFIDRLPLSFQQRMNSWDKVLDGDFESRSIWVAEADTFGIVGFAVVDKARDDQFKDYGEIGAIYLLKAFHGTKTGFELLKAGMLSLIELGYHRAYCWVLEGNPTIRFYERSGARKTATQQTDEIGGERVQELAFIWDDISKFK